MSEKPSALTSDTACALKRIAFWVGLKFLLLIALTLVVLRWKGLI
ncbi:MAG: hypothetical protein Q8S29_13850 [Phreatobacter sp.]|nr:hypothetical protein [Phreatobacter sp.]